MARPAGFVKKHATDLAYDARDELGVSPFQRLDLGELAKHLAIPVVALSSIREANPSAADFFLAKEPTVFSAVTIFKGPSRIIVHNDGHAPARQASNVSHELAHGLLLHDPSPALDDSGCRDWDQTMEDQAQWVAGALLVHELALVAALRRRESIGDIARRLGVSDDMVRWRINVTGARRRAG